MELLTKVKQNQNLIRLGSALALAVLAVRSFANGKRLRGLVAAGGAVAVGASASTLDPTPVEIEEVEAVEGVDEAESTAGDGELRCGVCQKAIVTGQSRRPNEDDDIVHEACL